MKDEYWIPGKGTEEFRKDIMFWQGFDMAIDLVMKVFDESPDDQFAIFIKESINEEIERYKKDE